MNCATGVVTTQTIQAAATGIGGGDDSAAVRTTAISGLLVVLGALGMAYNVL